MTVLSARGLSQVSGGVSGDNSRMLSQQLASRDNSQVKVNSWVGNVTPSGGQREEDSINEKVVQTIVTKLGYTADEVRSYVQNDKNSFVGVLYQKLVDDQREKNLQM